VSEYFLACNGVKPVKTVRCAESCFVLYVC